MTSLTSGGSWSTAIPSRTDEAMKRIFLTKLTGAPLSERLREALDWVGWERIISPKARIFVKPNLVWKDPRPGVTVSPELLEALVALLSSRTSHITIGESDGGYYAFPAEEALQSHGVYDLAERYGIRAVNLSRLPSERVLTRIGQDDVEVELPSILLHDTDMFVTVPVPKVHAMTGVSLGFKNQWGCIPSAMRLELHPVFNKTLAAVNALVKPRLAVYDGRYFLDRNGPMVGEPVFMDLLMVSNDIGAGDVACCRIMGVDSNRITHLRYAREAGVLSDADEDATFNIDPATMARHTFRVRRNLVSYLELASFHSSAVTKLLFRGPVGRLIHSVLYAIRKNAVVARILYGKFGFPQQGESQDPA